MSEVISFPLHCALRCFWCACPCAGCLLSLDPTSIAFEYALTQKAFAQFQHRAPYFKGSENTNSIRLQNTLHCSLLVWRNWTSSITGDYLMPILSTWPHLATETSGSDITQSPCQWPWLVFPLTYGACVYRGGSMMSLSTTLIPSTICCCFLPLSSRPLLHAFPSAMQRS